MKKIANLIILAAGRSTRFWPFADKNTFKFAGKPLVAHQIKKISPYVKKIFVIANEENKPVIDSIAQDEKVAVFLQEGEGQASALLSVKDKVRGEAVVINNVDVFNEKIVFGKFAKLKDKFDIILTAKEMKDYFPGGYLRLKNKKVVELIEKPKPENKPSNFARLVADYFSDFEAFLTVLREVKDPYRDGAFEEGLNKYFKTARATYIDYKDYWIFLKYPWNILSVRDYFLKNLEKSIGKNVSIAPTAKIEGKVHFADNVIVHEFAKIVGPCFIGRNSVIGNYAMAIKSMVGEGSIVGGYCELTRSYLGDNVMLHRNYVGDSALDSNVMMGAGAVCANFRFDEGTVRNLVKGELMDTKLKKLGAFIGEGAKLGVNSSIMPGVKVAPGQVVAPNSMVRRDIFNS